MKLTKQQLKQIIKEELEEAIQEAIPAAAGFGQSTVFVRVKPSAEKGPPPKHLRPEQENMILPGLTPTTEGEVPEDEWNSAKLAHDYKVKAKVAAETEEELKAAEQLYVPPVNFAWPREDQLAGKRRVKPIQIDYLQLDLTTSREK